MLLEKQGKINKKHEDAAPRALKLATVVRNFMVKVGDTETIASASA